MLSQFKGTGIFRISVHELKNRFGLIDPKTGKENSYADFSLFSTKVLKVAREEINECTDIKFDYKTKKTGRKVTDLEFRITQKPFLQGATSVRLDNKEKSLPGQKYNLDHDSLKLEGETLKQYIYFN
jgi:plasmid replication initiation protein